VHRLHQEEDGGLELVFEEYLSSRFNQPAGQQQEEDEANSSE
jgi:hypothetical protein